MPVYVYEAQCPENCCQYCVNGFELAQSICDPHVATCPICGKPIRRVIMAPTIGRSKSKLDARAKAAGFTKLKRLGKGEYEKMY